MLKNLLSAVWRKIPARLRLWSVRATNARFTVTAGAVIFNRRGEVLLLKHRFRPGSGWGLPGGFLQAGEQPQDALRRELCEETGLEIDKVEIFSARSYRKSRQIEIVFVAQAEGEAQPKSLEIERAAWFAPATLPEGLPNDQLLLIQRAAGDGANRPD
jgi:ADP-ribose pyrophosphatase YjhB (NUDIX family)